MQVRKPQTFISPIIPQTTNTPPPPNPWSIKRVILLLLFSRALSLPLFPLNLRNLLLLGALRIPLPRLQHQHADQHQRQNRIARRIHPQRILPADIVLALGQIHFHILALHARELQVPVDARGHDAEPLDDVGQVHGYACHVEHERCAVEEHVGLGGFEELDQEAEEAGADDEVQDARDDGWRGVEELDVGLEQVKVRLAARRGRRPEDVVVVREVCKEDAEEETCCWCED